MIEPTDDDSFPAPRTKKAATPPPSITSSTTGGRTRRPTIKRLSAIEQDDLLDWLFRGASPQAACQKLDLDVRRFWLTLARNRRFAEAVDAAFDTLGLNVVAAAYREAIKGSVGAQALWLRHRPGKSWPKPKPSRRPEATGVTADVPLLETTCKEDAALDAEDLAGEPPAQG